MSSNFLDRIRTLKARMVRLKTKVETARPQPCNSRGFYPKSPTACIDLNTSVAEPACSRRWMRGYVGMMRDHSLIPESQ